MVAFLRIQIMNIFVMMFAIGCSEQDEQDEQDEQYEQDEQDEQ